MRFGFTLVDLLVAITVLGVIVALAIPTTRGLQDRLAVQRARSEVEGLYRTARLAAVLHGRSVTLRFSPDSTVARFRSDGQLVRARPGPATWRVSFSVSRDRITLGPLGLGVGAANTSLVFTKGSATDSIHISRLGRLRSTGS